MRRIATAAAITAALTLSFPVMAAKDAIDPGLRAANDAEVRAFLAADAKGLSSLWADTFVVNNPLGKLVTGSQVVTMVSSGVLRFQLTHAVDRLFPQLWQHHYSSGDGNLRLGRQISTSRTNL